MRTLADSRDADDLAVVAALQDLMTIDATRARAFSMPDYDAGSFERTRHALLSLASDVPVDGFWSISVYNADGFFEPNPGNAYSVNSVTAVHDNDGGVTVRFGGDGDPARNSIPITDGWNYLVRLYRPHQRILDGTWIFPALSDRRS